MYHIDVKYYFYDLLFMLLNIFTWYLEFYFLRKIISENELFNYFFDYHGRILQILLKNKYL